MAKQSSSISPKISPADGVLPPEVAAEYEVTDGVLSIFADSEFGYVDLNTITLDFARQLAGRGYLKLRQPAGQ